MERPGQSTHRQVLRLAGPLILANLSVALLGVADTAVVGHLEDPAFLGAVAMGAVIFDFLYWSCGFLRMGATGLTAQARGAGDGASLRQLLARGMVLALGLALLFLLLQAPIVDLALWAMSGTDRVKGLARDYFLWRIWSAPAVLGGMVLMGTLLGLQDARSALLVTVTINLVNVALDFLFVWGLGLDVRGVALASVLAEFSGFLLALLLVRRGLRGIPGPWSLRGLLRGEALRRQLALNGDIFLRTLALVFVFAFFTRQGALAGEVVLAANAVLLNFQLLMALGLDGFANALEALVGRYLGARDGAGFRRVVRVAGGWCLLLAAGYTLAYAVAGEGIIALLTGIPAVRETAGEYLPWVVASPLVSVWCFLLDGIFIGAAMGRAMRNTMLLATFGVFLPLWWLARGLGNHGLWLALLGFLAARGVLLGRVYLKELLPGAGGTGLTPVRG